MFAKKKLCEFGKSILLGILLWFFSLALVWEGNDARANSSANAAASARNTQNQTQSTSSSANSTTGPINVSVGGGQVQSAPVQVVHPVPRTVVRTVPVQVPVPVKAPVVTNVVPAVVQRAPVPVQQVPIDPGPRAIVVAAPPPVSVLPSTGPADFAWGLLGLLPLGWILRRFGMDKLQKVGEGKFLWDKREFDRGQI